SPLFTFSTAELLAKTLAEVDDPVAVAAQAELADLVGEGGWGAAFARSEVRATPEPIAIHGSVPDRLDAVVRLGAWAASSLDVAGLLAHDPLFATVCGTRALVAWRSGDVVFGASTGVHGPARLLNRRSLVTRKDATRGGV